MSLKIPGKLVVQVRNGSRGSFAVGDLITQVGSFKVKDQFLDQFAEGEYEGEFIVTQIYPNCYTYRGSVTTEIRAKIVDYILATAEEKPVNPEPEPDPIDQAAQGGPVTTDSAPKADAPAVEAPKARESSRAGKTSDTSAPAELFDEETIVAIKAGQPIKLDPTIDRQKFRAQRDYLKNVCKPAYEFRSFDQTWYQAEGQQ